MSLCDYKTLLYQNTLVFILHLIASQLVCTSLEPLFFIFTQCGTTSLYVCVYPARCLSFVCVQNDRYTVGGSEMFDTLTDLVECYKRTGIEEMSGNWVYFKQVNGAFFFYVSKLWR